MAIQKNFTMTSGAIGNFWTISNKQITLDGRFIVTLDLYQDSAHYAAGYQPLNMQKKIVIDQSKLDRPTTDVLNSSKLAITQAKSDSDAIKATLDSTLQSLDLALISGVEVALAANHPDFATGTTVATPPRAAPIQAGPDGQPIIQPITPTPTPDPISSSMTIESVGLIGQDSPAIKNSTDAIIEPVSSIKNKAKVGAVLTGLGAAAYALYKMKFGG